MAGWLAAAVLALWSAGCASLPANAGRVESHAIQSGGETLLGRLVAQRHAVDHAKADSGFHLLAGADEAYKARIALIDEAERTLDLQYYAIHADSTTEVLLEHLRAAARRGVRVRVLLDDFNTVGKDAQVLRLAFEPNVQLRLFNPIPGSRQSLVGRLMTSLHDIDRVQKRMHNKLFIADNAIGITGGRNLGDEYFGFDDKSNFVDLEVLAQGQVVQGMSASFDRYWNDELAYPMQTLVTPQQLEELRKPASSPQDPSGPGAVAGEALAPASAPVPASSSAVMPTAKPAAVASVDDRPLDLRALSMVWAPSLVLSDKPGKIGPDDDEANAGETVVDGLLHLMLGAHRDLLIVSPYFVPGTAMMDTFGQLRAKGVRIRVLTNSLASNDAIAAHAGYARYRHRLLDLGVELYEMRAEQGDDVGGLGSGGAGLGSAGGGSKTGVSHASLHSKAVLIDSRLAVIGSMNLDLRSQRKNSEVALLIRSAALAQDAARRIEGTFAHGAYRVESHHGKLVWRAPPGANFKDSYVEPQAGTKRRLLSALIKPIAPEEML